MILIQTPKIMAIYQCLTKIFQKNKKIYGKIVRNKDFGFVFTNKYIFCHYVKLIFSNSLYKFKFKCITELKNNKKNKTVMVQYGSVKRDITFQ